jgi:hypothetical protein
MNDLRLRAFLSTIIGTKLRNLHKIDRISNLLEQFSAKVREMKRAIALPAKDIQSFSSQNIYR